tara:strand:+ start:8389 stop:8763 length:375 start_codon:yes stop_codon:yes gene_type:complete
MAAFLDNAVFDQGLDTLDNDANKIVITSQQATTFAEANVTYALGDSTSLSIGPPSDRAGGGREVTIAAITDGSVTGTGTASHYALLNTTGSVLLAANTLTNGQAVTNGNTFTLGSFTVGIPDPV